MCMLLRNRVTTLLTACLLRLQRRGPPACVPESGAHTARGSSSSRSCSRRRDRSSFEGEQFSSVALLHPTSRGCSSVALLGRVFQVCCERCCSTFQHMPAPQCVCLPMRVQHDMVPAHMVLCRQRWTGHHSSARRSKSSCGSRRTQTVSRMHLAELA